MEGAAQMPGDAVQHRVIRLDSGLTALVISRRAATERCCCARCSAPLQALGVTVAPKHSAEAKPSTNLQQPVGGISRSPGPAPVLHGSAKSKEHIDVGHDGHKPQTACRYSLRGEALSAAALCVGVGSFHDPGRLQGLAHLLEHTITAASERYPNKDSFSTFLSQHGGSSSSYTHRESTVFSMDVPQEFLREALDMLASILAAPLITKDATEAGAEAVQNEFRQEHSSDGVRIQQLFGSLACDGHPMRKFLCGNMKTLMDVPGEAGIDVTAELKRFFDEHYSPEIMTLAVLSQHSIDELVGMVNDTFSLIPIRLTKQKGQFYRLRSVTQFPLDRFSYMIYWVKPVEKVNKLSVTWALPSLLHEYRTKPIQYIAWIVGHQGAGSISAYLRGRSWAHDMFAGNTGSSFEHNSLCSLFNIFVALTEEGLKHLPKVLTAIFGFMTMARKQGPSLDIFNEVKKVGDTISEGRLGMDPQDYVLRLSQNMQVYPPEHYFGGDDRFYEYNPELIQLCMDIMVPEKANIIVLSTHYHKRGAPTHEQPYMQTKYTIENIPEDWKAEWSNPTPDPYFRLPGTNKYIATDFSIKEETEYLSQIPTKVHEDERCRLWFKYCGNFEDRKACVYVHLISPLPQASATNAIMLGLFADVLKHSTKQETGAARRASLDSSIYLSWCGLVIQLCGFTEKFPVLLDAILNDIVCFEAQEEQFLRAKEELHKHYIGSITKPSSLAEDVRLSLLRQSYWSDVEKSAFVKGLTLASLRRFVKTFRSNLLADILAQGNLSAVEARKVAEHVVQKLGSKPLTALEVPRARVLQIPTGSHYCRIASFRTKDPSSAIVNYYQLGQGDVGQHALASLMADIIEEPCVDYLERKSHVGHHVSCHNKNTFGVVGFLVSVSFSSKERSSTFVDDEIEAFLRKISVKIQQMGEDHFHKRLSSLIKRKSYSDVTLKEEADIYWEEITSSGYMFDRLQQEAQFLKGLTLDDFKAWCISLLPFNSPGGGSHRRKLSVQVVGHSETAHAATPSTSSTQPSTSSSSGADIHGVSGKSKDLHPGTHREDPHGTSKASSSDAATYCLRLLDPSGKGKDENTISDIAAFKKGLSVYPLFEENVR